jgi:hypothetical protein
MAAWAARTNGKAKTRFPDAMLAALQSLVVSLSGLQRPNPEIAATHHRIFPGAPDRQQAKLLGTIG